MVRPYKKRTKEERLNAILNQIDRLDTAAAKRLEKIGKLKNKAQILQQKNA